MSKRSASSSNKSVREHTGTHEIGTKANQIKYVIYSVVWYNFTSFLRINFQFSKKNYKDSYPECYNP